MGLLDFVAPQLGGLDQGCTAGCASQPQPGVDNAHYFVVVVVVVVVVVDNNKMRRRVLWLHDHLLSPKILLHCMLLVCQHLKVQSFMILMISVISIMMNMNTIKYDDANKDLLVMFHGCSPVFLLLRKLVLS